MIDPISLGAQVAPAALKAVMPGMLTRIKGELVDMTSDIHHAFFNAFSTYTQGAYEKHCYFSSLVFPNQQLKLKDYYIPLTLLAPTKQGSNELLIDDFPAKFLTEKKDLLIVDFAGMGKSTVLKFMFLRAVELDLGIPVFIELRKLSEGQSVLNYVLEQLKSLNGDLDNSLVIRLLGSGEFIFFLDGFDEITDSNKTHITNQLREFKRLANKNRFLISSRDQIGLSAFSDFFRLTIKPLELEEAYSLIRKYSRDSNIGEALIDKLAKPDSAPIIEFLSNPLLVSLLFKAYEYKQTIPLRKHIFYRQVFEALFENHDLSKDAGELNRRKLCDLDIYSFEIVMRSVGFLSLESGKVEYPKDEMLLLLEKAKNLSAGIPFNPQALLQDLISRVPLFVMDGNYYRWNHKSIQEYFAALHLSSNGVELQREVLQSMYHGKKAHSYSNFLSLFSDIDAKGFRQIFLPLLLRELISAFGTSPVLKNISIESQRLRHKLSAFRYYVYVNLTKNEIKPFIENYENRRKDGAPNAFNPELDFFTISRGKLISAGIDVAANSGSHAIANDVVVTVHTPRWHFVSQLINSLGLDFLKIIHPRHSARITDQYEQDESMPQGFTLLTSDADNPLNSAALFDATNRKLMEATPVIEFDLDQGESRLREIELEIQSAGGKSFSF